MSYAYYTYPPTVIKAAVWSGDNLAECQALMAEGNSNWTAAQNEDGSLTVSGQITRTYQVGQRFENRGLPVDPSYWQEVGSGPGYNYGITETGQARSLAK